MERITDVVRSRQTCWETRQ